MAEERTIRRSRRWAVGIVIWLIGVPALLFAVKALLPSDNLLTGPPGTGETAGAVALQPVGTVTGIQPGDLLLAVDGVPVSAYLHGGAPARSVHAGDVLTYRIRHNTEVRDVPVRIAAHPDLLNLVTAGQPDAVLVSLAMLGLACWLFLRRPGVLAAHAFLVFAAGWASDDVSSWAWVTPLDLVARPWVSVWAFLGIGGYLVTGISALLFALAFPRPVVWFRSRPWLAVATAPLLITAGFAVRAAVAGPQLEHLAGMDLVAELIWEPCVLVALLVMIVRWIWLRKDAEARRRAQIVVLGFATAIAVMVIGRWIAIPAGTFGFGLVLLVFPASVAVAVGKRDLFELDLALNRGLVAVICGAVLLGLYLAAAAVTVALSGQTGPAAALPGAGLVAVAFAPVRAAAQRVITRRLFGTGGDPQLVLHRLGLRLEASDDPESLLAAVVDTAAESLRLPYVAVELWSGTGWQATRQRGRRPANAETAHVESLNISVGDQVVGRLVVAPRPDAKTLSPLDRQLLSDLARHSGVAARVVGLLTDLRAAQQRLLVAREEERFRIHRDLHDGLGSTLTGLTLHLEVAADLAGDGELGTLARRMHKEAARATEDVRRIVREVRPGELEELGLPAAVAAAAARLRSPNAPTFDLDMPTLLPDLPPEVEDAAYKISLEAMTNVIRHSRADRCRIQLRDTGSELELEISDDGEGFDADNGPGEGTGQRSMRDRAAAVGGTVTVTAGAGTGTRVLARLPLSRRAAP
ncbi:histidine kinase [Dactylosporangium sp. McL0621]|uniref:sensor histidine kinase n=1 Tax=Dactylosporangium sp. McL0621 TaxID=3415678 RepID=UPI003CF56F99